jgi:hypothetical protein
MLQITLARRPGEAPITELPEEELFARATRSWVMNPNRAKKERYAVIIGEGQYVMAIEIGDIKLEREAPEGGKFDDRYRIEAKILRSGHPVYDAYKGRPATGTRNPVRYLTDDAHDLGDCLCGCGGKVKGFFLPGHDQRAIHERVSKLGSVKHFLEWFDATYAE